MKIDGKRCILRSWCEADVEALPAIANSKAIWQNLRDRFPHPYTPADARWWVDLCKSAQDHMAVFAVEVDGELAGGVGLESTEDEDRRHTRELGYWIAERFQGRGIATDAVRTLCDYGFEQAGVVRIHAEVFPWNTASMRVLEKNGFIREGTLKSALMKDGKIIDTHLYAKLKPQG